MIPQWSQMLPKWFCGCAAWLYLTSVHDWLILQENLDLQVKLTDQSEYGWLSTHVSSVRSRELTLQKGRWCCQALDGTVSRWDAHFVQPFTRARNSQMIPNASQMILWMCGLPVFDFCPWLVDIERELRPPSETDLLHQSEYGWLSTHVSSVRSRELALQKGSWYCQVPDGTVRRRWGTLCLRATTSLEHVMSGWLLQWRLQRDQGWA